MKVAFGSLPVEVDFTNERLMVGGVGIYLKPGDVDQFKRMVAGSLEASLKTPKEVAPKPEDPEEEAPVTKQSAPGLLPLTMADKLRSRWRERLRERQALGLCLNDDRKHAPGKKLCRQCIRRMGKIRPKRRK